MQPLPSQDVSARDISAQDMNAGTVTGLASPAPGYANGSAQPYPAAAANTIVYVQAPVQIPPEVHCCCCVSIDTAINILIFLGTLSLA